MGACISLQYVTVHCLYFNWSYYIIVIFIYVQANPNIAPRYRATPSLSVHDSLWTKIP